MQASAADEPPPAEGPWEFLSNTNYVVNTSKEGTFLAIVACAERKRQLALAEMHVRYLLELEAAQRNLEAARAKCAAGPKGGSLLKEFLSHDHTTEECGVCSDATNKEQLVFVCGHGCCAACFHSLASYRCPWCRGPATIAAERGMLRELRRKRLGAAKSDEAHVRVLSRGEDPE